MLDREPLHEGTCRCGAVRFEARGAPMVTMACHCTGCQRMTASAYSLSSLYDVDRFAVTRGQTVVGGARGETRHMFCPDCMSWLFSFPAGGVDNVVNVRATLLDNARSYRPFAEFYTSERLPWATTGARHSFEKFPSPEEFLALLAEFARQSD